MFIPKKNRIAIYSYLFKEGVCVVKKDSALPTHPPRRRVDPHAGGPVAEHRAKSHLPSLSGLLGCTPQAWRPFRHHVEDPEWPQKLAMAKENPRRKEAQGVKYACWAFRSSTARR